MKMSLNKINANDSSAIFNSWTANLEADKT